VLQLHETSPLNQSIARSLPPSLKLPTSLFELHPSHEATGDKMVDKSADKTVDKTVDKQCRQDQRKGSAEVLSA
jgi:hypothetical protein